MSFIADIKQAGAEAVQQLFQVTIAPEDLLVNETKPEFEGDYTLVLFPLQKRLRQSPEVLGRQLGDYLIREQDRLFVAYNVIKGFLNLRLADGLLQQFLHDQALDPAYGTFPKNGQKVMVEFSSPNTNKPLHLGHLRNNFLGYAYARILEACGFQVIKANLVNDRGIHICKSMVAWQHFGQGDSPEKSGMKGDHFVGKYYVKFNEVFLEQVKALQAKGMDKETAEREAPIQKEAAETLRKWEQQVPKTLALWSRMNEWVYKGFEETYRRMGVDFDQFYHESETYLLGKKLVKEGLKKGLFYKKENGSVWVDLTGAGLDEKLLLRADGTSVYMTQDLGTAQLKYDDYQIDQSIYVIGDEQNYHMKVLKLILQKLEKPYADGIFHLSYGMVELPNGRMKSREGTVVDADDLMDDMVHTAAQHTKALGKVQDFTAEELQALYETLGLGAMKFYLLRVDPKKKMVFNPEESIDFHGFTGPFIQYTYARIQSIFRREKDLGADWEKATGFAKEPLHPREKAVILQLELFPALLREACEERNPSLVALYGYNLAKTFNALYNELSVSQAESESKKTLRLQLCLATSRLLSRAMGLLGIRLPERM